MPKLPKSSLQIDVVHELKWTNICHWFVTFFTTWVIGWLLNHRKCFVRSKPTFFVCSGWRWHFRIPPVHAKICPNYCPQNVNKCHKTKDFALYVTSICALLLIILSIIIKLIIESFVHVEMYTKVSRLLPNQKNEPKWVSKRQKKSKICSSCSGQLPK